MALADTLQGFKDGMENTGSDNAFLNFFSGLFSGAENIWKGVTGQSSNEKINAENIAMQQKNLDYQMALQQEIFNREDTSYARTLRDMRSSGLNPLTMKGTNGAGSVVPTQAPQKQFESVNAIPLITQALGEINALSVGQAQRDNINAQTKKQELENKLLEETYNSRRNGENARNNTDVLNYRRSERDYGIEHFTGQYGNQFFSDINKMRIATGKKPLHYNPFLLRDGGMNGTDVNLDFNEIVDYSRAVLTGDLLSGVAEFLKHNPVSATQKKGNIKINKQKVMAQ